MASCSRGSSQNRWNSLFPCLSSFPLSGISRPFHPLAYWPQGKFPCLWSPTSIGALAFEDCFSLTSVVILGRITTLDFGVFYACTSLTLIEIPNSVTSIDNEAFYDCSSLTSIVISSSVSYIGERAFEGCSSLSIYCEADSKPKGWNADWNISNCPVYWKGEWIMAKNGPKPLNK